MLKLLQNGTILQQRTAAFGRLCVETGRLSVMVVNAAQPPSGGCVLKHNQAASKPVAGIQPPSGGCVLKLLN